MLRDSPDLKWVEGEIDGLLVLIRQDSEEPYKALSAAAHSHRLGRCCRSLGSVQEVPMPLSEQALTSSAPAPREDGGECRNFGAGGIIGSADDPPVDRRGAA
jgi:hypothetical protein